MTVSALTSLVLPAGYGFILLDAVILCILCTADGFAVGRLRSKLFSKSFFDQHFPDLKPYPRSGYPDAGQGIFADKLSRQDWITFNSAMRAHQNFVEGLAPALVLLFIGGLVYTKWAALLGAVHAIGRLVYSIGYRTAGPSGRRSGAIIQEIGVIGLLVLTFISIWSIVGGVSGATKFIFS